MYKNMIQDNIENEAKLKDEIEAHNNYDFIVLKKY